MATQSELDEAWAAADEYELLWHRAREGCRGATRGLERALRWKAEAEARSLENKVQRLSLRIIELWGKEAE